MRDSLKYRLAIHQANTPEEVLTAVRSYFVGLTADETAALPEPLREIARWGVEEVINAGILLADSAELASAHEADPRVLREVTSVVTLAGLRMSILAMDQKRASSSGRRS